MLGPGIQYIFLGFCIQDSNSFLMASNIGIGYESLFFIVKKEFYRKNMNLSFSLIISIQKINELMEHYQIQDFGL